MKKIVLLFICFVIVATKGQSQFIAIVQGKVEALNQAIFVKKDSVALQNLLAKVINYGHSNGNVEDRKTMMENALNNKSTYATIQTNVLAINEYKNTVVARHIISGVENKPDGTTAPLKLSVLQTWVKEKKDWKLAARQAVKVIN